jgi:hypothetical protein
MTKIKELCQKAVVTPPSPELEEILEELRKALPKVGPCAEIHSRRLKVFDPEDTLTLEEIVSRQGRLKGKHTHPSDP